MLHHKIFEVRAARLPQIWKFIEVTTISEVAFDKNFRTVNPINLTGWPTQIGLWRHAW